MEFFGIGLPEILVILAIALIVVGPKRLPEMAAELARSIRTLQKYASSIRKEFNETMQEIEREYDDIKGEWKEVGEGLDEATRPVADELRAAEADTKDAISSASGDPRTPEQPARRPQ